MDSLHLWMEKSPVSDRNTRPWWNTKLEIVCRFIYSVKENRCVFLSQLSVPVTDWSNRAGAIQRFQGTLPRIYFVKATQHKIQLHFLSYNKKGPLPSCENVSYHQLIYWVYTANGQYDFKSISRLFQTFTLIMITDIYYDIPCRVWAGEWEGGA